MPYNLSNLNKYKLSKNLTRRNREEQITAAINFIKNNPSCTVPEIQDKTGVNAMKTFGSITHAYKAAGIPYPKREVVSGVMNPDIVKRCHTYEKTIIKLLSNLGDVIPKVRTDVGIADCLFRYKGKDFVVEIKDYRGKNNITMYEMRQLLNYMKDLHCRNGLLICPRGSFPKRKYGRNVYIGDLMIKILSEDDIIGGVV